MSERVVRSASDWVVTWPVCTAHPECDHDVRHPSGVEADVSANDHMGDWVNDRGVAICTCHPAAEAEAHGVTAFPCDQAATQPARGDR